MKKSITLVLMLLLVLTMVFATGANEKKTSGKPVELEFIQWWASEDGGDFFDSVITEFETQNPGIKIKLVTMPFGDSRNQVIASHATGMTSDIIGMNPPWTREFVDMGILEPLDRYMDNDATFDRAAYFPASMAPVQGHTYLAPYNTMTFFLFYNKLMFAEAGVNPPKTWDEMLVVAKKLTKPAENKYGFTMVLSETDAANGSILTIYPLLYALNGRTFVDGKFTVKTPQMVKTLDFIQKLNAEGAILPGSTSKSEMASYEEFTNGNIGMMIAHTGMIMTMKNRNPNFDFGVIKIPTFDGTGNGDLRHHGWDIAMSADSKHKDEAWKYISFLLQKQNMIDGSNSLLKIPSMYDAPVNYAGNMPLIVDAIRDMNNSTMVEELMTMPKSAACWTALTKAGSQIIQGKMTSSQAIEKVQSQWDEILNQ